MQSEQLYIFLIKKKGILRCESVLLFFMLIYLMQETTILKEP